MNYQLIRAFAFVFLDSIVFGLIEHRSISYRHCTGLHLHHRAAVIRLRGIDQGLGTQSIR